jgi:phospholipase C
MPAPDNSHALDRIVVVLFENRSFDNVLGHLYGPDDGKTFEGVIGKDLSNPTPAWAERRTCSQRLWPTPCATTWNVPWCTQEHPPGIGQRFGHPKT